MSLFQVWDKSKRRGLVGGINNRLKQLDACGLKRRDVVTSSKEGVDTAMQDYVLHVPVGADP